MAIFTIFVQYISFYCNSKLGLRFHDIDYCNSITTYAIETLNIVFEKGIPMNDEIIRCTFVKKDHPCEREALL